MRPPQRGFVQARLAVPIRLFSPSRIPLKTASEERLPHGTVRPAAMSPVSDLSEASSLRRTMIRREWPILSRCAACDHSTANSFCNCSRGMFLVSGTIVFTHTSCRHIVPAKNENTYPGGKDETILGKKVV